MLVHVSEMLQPPEGREEADDATSYNTSELRDMQGFNTSQTSVLWLVLRSLV